MPAQTPTDRIVAPCRALARRQDPCLRSILTVARQITLTEADLDALSHPDPAHPYGRRVLMAEPRLEVMVATWTPGVSCAPHDHGGSVGGVKVLRGRSRHRIYAVEDGALVLRREHTAETGEILAFGENLIHSMTSIDPDVPLMTLHFYTDAIEMMVVYTEDETLAVDGGCGAWVPEDAAMVLHRLSGVCDRDAMKRQMGLPPSSCPAVD